MVVSSLQADERWGFACNKQNLVWEAELIDPLSKFVIAREQGPRDKELIQRLLEDGAQRLNDKHSVVLLTDGEPSYASVFPEVFGVPYYPERNGWRGRWPKVRYRIPRSLAHVQIVKTRTGKKLRSVDIRYRHETRGRVMNELFELGYRQANTSIIERRNATARLMNSTMQRKTLAFARHSPAKLALGWWTLTVYNWCRPHRMLRSRVAQYYGESKYVDRTPAMAVGVAPEVFTEEMLLRTQVFQSKGWR